MGLSLCRRDDGGTEEMTEGERAQRDAYLRVAMMGAAQKPSLEARLDWLEADASAQRTAILKLERKIEMLAGAVVLGPIAGVALLALLEALT
jgi:hypothetical protein